jgi:hypothetical protein
MKLCSKQIGEIRKRRRWGYRVWKIAADLRLTEWQVAKQLKADGEQLGNITGHQNLRNTFSPRGES